MESKNFLPETTDKKSLWNDKERIVGGITGLGLIGGGLWLLYKVLPYLISIMENTLYFGFLTVVTVGSFMLIWKNRKMLWVLYQIFIQKMWWAIANAHPIKIMKIGLRNWQQKRQELDGKITALQSSYDQLKRAIDQNSGDAQENFKFAKEAQKQNKGDIANSKAIRAKRLLNSNEQLIPRFNAIKSALEFLKKLFERWGIEIEDLADDIKLKERDLDILKQTSSALKSAQSLIEGNPDDMALAEMANQAYAQQLSNNVAYITRFMEKGKKWMDSSDIQDAILSNEGQELLNMYDEKQFAQLTNFKERVTLPAGDSGLSSSADSTMKDFNSLK